MGGGNSTPRRVTVEEDELSGVMRVSESVAKRLMGQPESTDSKQHAEKGSTSLSPQEQEEFSQLENYYKQRIEKLERRNSELFQEKKEEFANAVQEVEQKFLKTTASPICEALQTEVLKCYQENPQHTLHCSSLVKAFNDCVQKQREKILTRKG